MTKIGETIKQLRESKGFTQNDLARAAGVSQPTIADLESGKQQTSKKLPHIAKALGVTVGQIDKDFFVEWENFEEADNRLTEKIPSKPVFYDPASSLHERLKAVRGKRSQIEFGLLIGVTAQAVSQWEKGVTVPSRQNLELLCEKERLSLSWLLTGNKDQNPNINNPLLQSEPRKNQIENIITKVDTPLGARDLPVFAAVEGGDGDLVVSTEPVDLVPRPWYLGEVKDGYGVIVTGESMYPAYEPGDTAIVNPRLPYLRGKIHIFTAESENSHFKATIKRLVNVTATHWKVEQFNPPNVFELDRSIWTNARRVVGKYNG